MPPTRRTIPSILVPLICASRQTNRLIQDQAQIRNQSPLSDVRVNDLDGARGKGTASEICRRLISSARGSGQSSGRAGFLGLLRVALRAPSAPLTTPTREISC